MRQVKVFDTEEEVSESEDEHETACRLEAVDHEENYEDDDELLGFNTIKCIDRSIDMYVYLDINQ